MKSKGLGAGLLAISLALGGCAVFEGSLVSDGTVQTRTAEALGLAAPDVTITNRTDDSGTTYYTATTKSGTVYNCRMEGGTILSVGVADAPVCTKKD